MTRALTWTSVLTWTLWSLPGAAEPPDPSAVTAFADSYFRENMDAAGLPGAVVAVVRDGETVLLEGYGVADVESGAPVDPERTLFRLGSITKPLTAIAALRLAEQGVLDLDVDVNVYLAEIEVPAASGAPVTLRHLLSHTGGFDADMSFTNLPPGADARLPPAAIERRLQRLRPPGRIPSYDVVGFGLAGLVLRDVTGKPFAEVIREQVFEPLGMTRAVVGLPAGVEMARCHVSTRPGDARVCEHPVMSELVEGSGAAAATAADMARLMTALAAGGEIDGRRLLTPESFAVLTDFDRYRFHPFAPGLGHGLREYDRAGRRAFGHGGGISGFNNAMELFPDSGVGVYVGLAGGPEQVYDARLSTVPALFPDPTVPPAAREAWSALGSFAERFAEQFLPPRDDWPPRVMTAEERRTLAAADDTAALAGLYLHCRYVSNNLMVRLARHTLTATVERLGDAALRVNGRTYEPVAPLYYEDPETGRGVAFRARGAGTNLAFGGDPYGAFEKVPVYADPRVSMLPLPPALLLLLSAGVYLLPCFAGRRRWFGGLVVGGAALFLTGLVLELELATFLVEVRGAWLGPLLWRLGLHVGVLMSVGALALRAWRDFAAGPSKWIGIAHMASIGLAGTYVAWFAVYWALVDGG